MYSEFKKKLVDFVCWGLKNVFLLYFRPTLFETLGGKSLKNWTIQPQ